jgi:hypothetical protein
MSTAEIVIQIAAGILAAAAGWVARGIFQALMESRRNRAWRRTRRFLPSRTSKF